MNAARSLIIRHSRIAILLCVLVLVLRAIVPAGYMVGVQGKTITVFICGDGAMAQSIVIPMKPSVPKDAVPAHEAAPCAFAAMAWATDNAPVMAIDDRESAAMSDATLARSIPEIGHGLAAPPPPKTGPPSLL